MRFTALDIDLLLKESEAPDRAGMRILRQACASRGPRYPALVVHSEPKAFISFAPDQPVFIGRSRQCALRLDVACVSTKHARIGFESGEFWVEDLGSTEGTFVNKQQISGRVNVPPGTPISLGRELQIVGVASQDQLSRAVASDISVPVVPVREEKRYPVLLSLSESARPARIVLTPGSSFALGRDPASDMWLGAPHISRRHCVVDMTKAGLVRVTDKSTNGTAYDKGILHRNESVESSGQSMVFDFSRNVTVGLCFSEEDEKAFAAAAGSAHSFAPLTQENQASSKVVAARTGRRTTTWFKNIPAELTFGKEVPAAPRSTLGGLYAELSPSGRLAMTLVALGIFAVLCVVGSLLVSGLRW
jgi:pSer/pThr/pTyr-binding forkhead associated (FHA) protein